MKQSLVLLFHLFIVSSFITAQIHASTSLLRGVAPEDEKYYLSGKILKCKDGSKTFTRERLNDDFCDCPDSSDEPGTSACPGGKFFCSNAGHFPLILYSSRVNDAICDCCDGSDEYDGRMKCPNTCWQAGKAARDNLKKKIETYREGLSLRKQVIEQAKLSFSKDEADLSKLQIEEKMLNDIVAKLKERKELIDKAEEEERERLRKESEKKESEEKTNEEKVEFEEKNLKKVEGHEETDQEEGGTNIESSNNDKIGLVDETHGDEDATAHHNDLPVEIDDDNSGKRGHFEEPVLHEEDTPQITEELSREELGRIVASRWTGENTEQATADGTADEEEVSEDGQDEEAEGNGSETDDDHNSEDVDDSGDDFGENDDDSSTSHDAGIEEYLVSSNPSWLEKIQETVRSILYAVNPFKYPVDKSEADRVRKEYEESSSKLSKMQSKISSLKQKLKHDFGVEKEFYSFYGHCFETKLTKYTYKICPFRDATQVEEYSTTQLGRWERFEESFRAMVFSNGDKCWNGPDRSLKVRLRCGLKNEIMHIDEPSRCEYVALLSTPAVCVEEKLKEIQDKLDQMNKQQPHSHDEF